MTPSDFENAINKAIKGETLETVTTAGFAAMATALGVNAVAFLPAIDRLCRRMRQFDRHSIVRIARKPVAPLE